MIHHGRRDRVRRDAGAILKSAGIPSSPEGLRALALRLEELALREETGARYLSARDGAIENRVNGEIVTLAIAVVGRHTRATRGEILGAWRSQEIVFARHLAIFLVAEFSRMSTTTLGAVFGGRDHSTIISALKNVRKRRRTNPEFDRTVAAMVAEVRAELTPRAQEDAA